MSRQALNDALAGAGGASLYDTLVQKALLGEDELQRAAAHATGVPFVQLTRDDIDPEALMLIPEPLARTRSMVAYRREGNVLEVALLDLDDLAHLEYLRREWHVVPRLTSAHSLKHALLQYQKLLKEKFAALAHGGASAVDTLIKHALLSNAHGVHLDLSHTGLLVRYRIGEALHSAMMLPKEAAHLLGRLKELARLSFTLSTPQEGHFKVELDDNESVSVRVASTPVASGERMTLHLTRSTSGRAGYSLSSLGFHGSTLEEMHKLLGLSSGLILVSGPHRSGKTATLYTMLDMLSRVDASVVTVEREVEYKVPHVSQMQVRPEVGLHTAAVLRAALKHDPDVVMVGELDEESAPLAVSAAARGILVLAGIEALTAAQALVRMREWGVAPRSLAASVRGVVSTQRVRRLCKEEREEYRLARAEGEPLEARANFGRVLAALKEEGIVEKDKQWKDLLFARATSCSSCEGGYSGYTGLQEVLPVTAHVKEMLLDGLSAEEIEEDARKEGMQTTWEDGLFKAAQGITSIEEVVRVAQEEDLQNSPE